MTRFEMCDAIFAAFRLNGLVPAYRMWIQAVEEDLIDSMDLEIHARGNRIDEHAAQEIRDFDGVRRLFGKHGLMVRDPREVDELMGKIRNVSSSFVAPFVASHHGMPSAPNSDKGDDRALERMQHALRKP